MGVISFIHFIRKLFEYEQTRPGTSSGQKEKELLLRYEKQIRCYETKAQNHVGSEAHEQRQEEIARVQCALEFMCQQKLVEARAVHIECLDKSLVTAVFTRGGDSVRRFYCDSKAS